MKLFRVWMLIRLVRLSHAAWKQWTTYGTADGIYHLHINIATEAKEETK